jgi:hypothetical protein
VAYQSLYRRYRPGSFADVVGQAPVIRTLTNAITEDRLHHAYLFTGTARDGQDVDRSHPREGRELHRRSDAFAVRSVRVVRDDHEGHVARRHRARHGVAWRCRRRA